MRSNFYDVLNSKKLLVLLPIMVIFTCMIDIGFFEYSYVNGQFSSDISQNTTAIGTTKLTPQGSDLGDLEGSAPAIEYYDKALAIDPDYEYALAMKGYLFDRLGNYTGAIEYYDKALAIDPKDHDTLSIRNMALSKVSLINELNNRQGSGNIVNLTEEVKPLDLQIGLHLFRDPQSIDYLGDGYKVNPDVGVYFLADNDKSSYNTYQIPDYTQSLVQLSENQMNVDIAFKMPVFPKSTAESIERIEGLYDVKYIDTQPDYKRFIAFSNSSLTINNTQYSNLTIEVKKFDNDTGYLFLDGYKK
jgi:tetratricopeptide (TPR) repeat protein